MKKMFTLILITLGVFNMSFAANTVSTMKSSYNLTSDTITDTGNGYVQIQAEGSYETVTIQAVVTKISGTVAGNVVLRGSIDGTNFQDISTDSLLNTNVTTNTKIWVTDYAPYMYYRLYFVGVGTMAATLKGYALTTPTTKTRKAVSVMKSSYNSASDTVANSATGYVELALSDYYKKVSIAAIATKLSGTAAGTITVQGSIDGTNYVTVSSSYASATTLTVTNVTTSHKIFVITGAPYKYYRLSYTGTGTMSVKLEGKIMPVRLDY